MRNVMMASSAVFLATLIRRRYLRWGVTAAEQWSYLPGDTLLPDTNLMATRAISIHAAPEDVWPWIAQLGQGRGGFYSYDFLENLIGCDIHSADRVHPEWQHPAVGTEIKLAPQLPLSVAALEPGTALVLRGAVPMGSTAPPYDFTWAFVIRRAPDGTSRLVVRERYLYKNRWAPLIVQPAELLSCLMSVRMLRTIKKRAEQAPGDSLPLTANVLTLHPNSPAAQHFERRRPRNVPSANTIDQQIKEVLR
ncbi:hypothetical protein ABIB25_003860 [Nakamurella sp. UYEF19]|uniref:SRPBCC family protein n=1 Tax=Nakamurella sp. UYEF19 TaxID=1756392 RepID=UPI003399DF75